VTDGRHAVLELLLDHHPGLLSVEEVIREMTTGADTFADRDPVEVAIRELVEAGLATGSARSYSRRTPRLASGS
jgi:Fe2+ or Zn2+ uptake regulation protein